MPEFDTYYKRYVTPEVIALVKKFFSEFEIRHEKDPYFHEWDIRIWRSGIVTHIIADLTYSEKELIIKHAMRAIAGFDKE